MTIDGTDCPIQEPAQFDTSYYSHKIRKAGVRYEVGVNIQTGDLVWINGPYKCGAFPDLKIFRLKLKNLLDKDEFVKADNGYRGEPKCVRVASSFVSKKDKRAKKKVRARHETINGRFKKYSILSTRFRHDRSKHQMCFYAVASLEQISMDLGYKSYSVTY